MIRDISPDRVAISELLPTASYLNTRIEAEYTIPKGFTKEQVVDAAYNFIHETHRRVFPQMYLDDVPDKPMKIVSQGEDRQVGMAQAINECETITELEALRFLVEKKHPECKAAFTDKYQQLNQPSQ